MQSGLCIRPGDQAEIGAIDVQNRVGRLRMVQDITGIGPELQSLPFSDRDRLPHVRIKSPTSRDFHRPLPESAAVSRKRVFEKDLSRLRIEHSVERAKRTEALQTRN